MALTVENAAAIYAAEMYNQITGTRITESSRQFVDPTLRAIHADVASELSAVTDGTTTTADVVARHLTSLAEERRTEILAGIAAMDAALDDPANLERVTPPPNPTPETQPQAQNPSTPTPSPVEPVPPAIANAGLVDVRTYLPGVELDIRYATPDNFTGQQLYDSARAFVLPEVGERLQQVDAYLRENHGLALGIWDGYRPFSVSQLMAHLEKDRNKVAETIPAYGEEGTPERGSRHNHGSAVDVFVVRADGSPAPLPTDFDDFSNRSSWKSRDSWDPEARQNADALRAAMRQAGFEDLDSEWWHYSLPGLETSIQTATF